MVLLHIKRGEASQFLYETTVSVDVDKLTQEIAAIYNGRLKIRRIAAGWSRKFRSGSHLTNKKFYRNGRTCKLRVHAAIGDDWINRRAN